MDEKFLIKHAPTELRARLSDDLYVLTGGEMPEVLFEYLVDYVLEAVQARELPTVPPHARHSREPRLGSAGVAAPSSKARPWPRLPQFLRRR